MNNLSKIQDGFDKRSGIKVVKYHVSSPKINSTTLLRALISTPKLTCIKASAVLLKGRLLNDLLVGVESKDGQSQSVISCRPQGLKWFV